MKTFVIAQHHGVFLTLESLVDSGVDNIVVVIPSSQVEKYNKMYSENPDNKEFAVFKDYDKRIGNYIKTKNANIKAYVYDNFDIRNTVSSTLNFIKLTNTNEIAVCLMSGSVVIKNYTAEIKNALMANEFGACRTRVYQNNPSLSMYHMIGLPQVDQSLDVNFFIVDMSKITDKQLLMNDAALLSDITRRKKLSLIPREFNGKEDVLIGSAISARQTLVHNLKIQSGFVVNLWNKSIKNIDSHKSDEIFGYPFEIYSRYAQKINGYLPDSTYNKIVANGNESSKWTSGLYQCLDIIDL